MTNNLTFVCLLFLPPSIAALGVHDSVLVIFVAIRVFKSMLHSSVDVQNLVCYNKKCGSTLFEDCHFHFKVEHICVLHLSNTDD